MKNINLYDRVIITKDIDSRSIPSIHIPKGTGGTVLETATNKNDETEYLIGLDNKNTPKVHFLFKN